MSALSAASTYRENVGSLTLHVFNFTAVTGADTFASGLPNVIGFQATGQVMTGTTASGNGVSVSNSSGTFTFACDTAAQAVTLWVLSRT